MTFLNAALLAGLITVAIPPIIHLLNRRRFNVVDWGAMQFLQISQKTRRRILIEELILMAIRMGLIALMVLALAAPLASSSLFAKVGPRTNRDVVLVFDGSASMGYVQDGVATSEKAKEWGRHFLDALAPGDGVAVLQAKQQVVPVLGHLRTDLDEARTAIEQLPPVRGGADWPAALQSAFEVLAASTRPQREVIFLTDNQRYGWADETTMLKWELLATRLEAEGSVTRPRVWVVNVAKGRPADAVTWSLAPIRSTRAVVAAGREVTFRTALRKHGTGESSPPDKVRLEIDGRLMTERKPGVSAGDKGQVPLTFPAQRFPAPGSHLVSVVVEKDTLPGENRQDFALEVLGALPVLLIDGDPRPDTRNATRFLRSALTPDPQREPNPAVRARVLSIQDFTSAALVQDIAGPNTAPRVVALCNVARMAPDQRDAIERFLTAGGGVLVALGGNCDPAFYNEQCYRNGEGWLPAKLVEPVGDENNLPAAVRPQPASFYHPAVEIFREQPRGGLADAYFPRRWKLDTGDSKGSTKIALMTGNEPFLIEKPFRKGRVLICPVPLDDSWRTNIIDLPALPLLAHETMFYLAGSRSAEFNLQPGQPIRYRPAGEEPAGPVTVQPPEGPARHLRAEQWPFTYAETREPGVYKVSSPAGVPTFFVVQSDAREADLTPSQDEDRNKVKDVLPAGVLAYASETGEVVAELNKIDEQQELWWLLMAGVIVLLAGEVWMTRRLAQKSGV